MLGIFQVADQRINSTESTTPMACFMPCGRIDLSYKRKQGNRLRARKDTQGPQAPSEVPTK